MLLKLQCGVPQISFQAKVCLEESLLSRTLHHSTKNATICKRVGAVKSDYLLFVTAMHNSIGSIILSREDFRKNLACSLLAL